MISWRDGDTERSNEREGERGEENREASAPKGRLAQPVPRTRHRIRYVYHTMDLHCSRPCSRPTRTSPDRIPGPGLPPGRRPWRPPEVSAPFRGRTAVYYRTQSICRRGRPRRHRVVGPNMNECVQCLPVADCQSSSLSFSPVYLPLPLPSPLLHIVLSLPLVLPQRSPAAFRIVYGCIGILYGDAQATAIRDSSVTNASLR